MRSALLVAVLGLLLLIPARADAHSLTKRDARAGTIKFMGKVAWAFDEAQAGERVHVRPAWRCRRISHVTVACPVVLRLPTNRTVLRGYIRVHRTRQGLLGYLLPWDPAVIRETLGRAAGTDSIAETVQVGVE